MTTTVWQVARRPRWILALLLSLSVAAGFAALSQWQLDRALANGTVDSTIDSETVRPLESVALPAQTNRDSSVGQRVSVEARVIDGDYAVLPGRINGGVTGYWVVGHLRSQLAAGTDADLALALGWTDDRDEADATASALNTRPQRETSFTGRYVSTEAPALPEKGAPAETLTMMSSAAFVNVWEDVAHDVYEGYLVSADPVDGLDAIDAPRPVRDVSLNWLNVFYAVEWVVFAGFALYLWYRLVKDTWEREMEEEADAVAASRTSVTKDPSAVQPGSRTN